MIEGSTFRDKDLLEKAVFASTEAGGAIMKVFNTDFTTEYKDDNSPLTLADKIAHEVISNALKGTGLPILSEEGSKIHYEERQNWQRFWLVDPLDGTKEFVKRNTDFTVNIALVENQIPVMGVIYIPITRTLYFASVDSGAFRLKMDNLQLSSLDEIMGKSEQLPFERKDNQFIVVASRSHLSPETEEFVEKLREDHPELEFVSRGSSLKMCLIAEGLADIYPRMGPTMEWDTAAGHALVEISGGSIYRADDGEPLLYNKKKLLNPWFVAKKRSVPGQA